MTRIVIVDDHDIIRQGLRSLIQSRQEYRVVAEAADADAALVAVDEHKPDIVLLDITMPGTTGLDVVNSIIHASPQTKILIISVHKAEPYILKALRLGVKGYLLKDNAAEELLPALERILRGEVYLGETVATVLAQRMAVHAPRALPGESLTPREREILRLVVEGKTAREIAEVLNISPRTVENNKNALLKKFALHRTVDLVKYALENKLVD